MWPKSEDELKVAVIGLAMLDFHLQQRSQKLVPLLDLILMKIELRN